MTLHKMTMVKFPWTPQYVYFVTGATLTSREPLMGHGKIKIVPCIKSSVQDDLMITRI